MSNGVSIMQINLFPSNNVNSNKNKSFGRYFDDRMVKWFERTLCEVRNTNPYLTDKDIATMRNSITSFNAFYKGAETINTVRIENEIYKKFGIPAHFNGDKYLAGLVSLTLNIFKKLNLPLPAMISKQRLRPTTNASCNPADRSVVFNSLVDWSDTQFEAIAQKFTHFSSSGHFLKTPLHEFMHSVNVARLKEIAMKKTQFVNSLNSQSIKKLLSMDFYTPKTIEGALPIKNKMAADYIQKNVSIYASTKPVEMFADIGTKMIADNLDYKTLLPKKHPFAFKDFTEDKYLMQIMNDVWNGNFDKYIRG